MNPSSAQQAEQRHTCPSRQPEGNQAMEEFFESVIVKTSPRQETRTKTKRPPPYAVILHNDSVNGFGFVVGVLQKVFGYARPKALRLTLTAHVLGRSTVWTGALEVAEFKAEQIRSCGPDPEQKSKGATQLGVSIEPVP
jgi:ATP-dependent Clp protease adaptor protein ClpS